MLSLGAIKNGALGAEAIVAFDDADRRGAGLPDQAVRPRHQQDAVPVRPAGGVPHRRAVAAPGHATPTSGWRSSWPSSQSLAAYGVRLLERVDVNMAFVELPAPAIDALPEAGMLCYRMGPTSVRLVTSWQTTADDVAEAASAFRSVVSAV